MLSFEAPEQFRDESLDFAMRDAREKYDRGQLEHGGRLWERDCFSDAWDEVLDLLHYMNGLRYQRNLATRILRAGLDAETAAGKDDALRRVLNLIETGSEGGGDASQAHRTEPEIDTGAFAAPV